MLELLARRHRLPARRARPATLRVNITITEPDGTTTKLNSPGPQATPEAASRELDRGAGRRAASADWVVLAGSLPPGAPPSCTPSSSPRCAAPAPASPSTPPTRRCRAGRRACPAPRPHLIKPNDEELASLTGADADELEADPAAAAAAARDLVDRGRRRRAGRPSARTAPCSSPPTAPGTPRPRRPPSSARSAPATPASPATSSGTSRGRDPATDSRSPSPTAARPPDSPARPSPTPSRSAPSWSRSRGLDLTPGGDHVRPHHRRAGPPRRRPRRRQARGDPRARRGRRRRRPRHRRRRLVADAFAREETSATGLPGGIAIPHCRTAAVNEPSLAFARSRRRSTSAPRTARPTWCSSSPPPRAAATRTTADAAPSSPAPS